MTKFFELCQSLRSFNVYGSNHVLPRVLLVSHTVLRTEIDFHALEHCMELRYKLLMSFACNYDATYFLQLTTSWIRSWDCTTCSVLCVCEAAWRMKPFNFTAWWVRWRKSAGTESYKGYWGKTSQWFDQQPVRPRSEKFLEARLNHRFVARGKDQSSSKCQCIHKHVETVAVFPTGKTY